MKKENVSIAAGIMLHGEVGSPCSHFLFRRPAVRLYILTLITICLFTLSPARAASPFDCPTTETFDCIRREIPPGEASPARPCDGAIFSIGEPVVFEPDPEFATGQFCMNSNPPFGTPNAGVTRSIIHSEIGALTSSEADIPDTIAFNIPGTVTIVRLATNAQTGSEVKVNNITIVDDGPEPVPPPVSVPPTEYVPKIEVEAVMNPDGTFGPDVATLDNSYSNLNTVRIRNSGTGDLVLKRVIMVGYQGISEIMPVGFVENTVVRPRQEFILDFRENVVDPDRYLQLTRGERILQTAMESNDPDERYVPVAQGASRVEEGGVTGPPPLQPINGIPSICNDANNDGVIDTSDLIDELLGGVN